MDFDQQIQLLIDNAPEDGVTPRIVEAIKPALKLLAEQLNHSQYYVVQTVDGNWVMTTLSNRTQPTLEKKVVYAFPTLKDAMAGQKPWQNSQLIALPVPVTHILFQMIAMEIIDSIIFFENPGDLATGTEVNRSDLQTLIQTYLGQNESLLRSQTNNLPPDIA